MSDTIGIQAPITNKNLKLKLNTKYIQLENDPEVLEKFEIMGKDFILKNYKT